MAQSTSSHTYSNILQSENYPSKNHAIILQKLENIEFTDHILALRKIIDIKSITDAYPMSLGRICIYLKTKQLVDEITENHKFIKINGQEAQIRKLVSTTKRLIISIPAFIPNELLLTYLNAHKIKTTSPITRVKLSSPELQHINSGRRQVYYLPDPTTPLPESITIEFENEPHRVFLSTEKCKICNRHGHTHDRCKNTTATTLNADDISPQTNTPPQENTNIPRKRTHTDTTNTQESECEQSNTQTNNPTKKINKNSTHSIVQITNKTSSEDDLSAILDNVNKHIPPNQNTENQTNTGETSHTQKIHQTKQKDKKKTKMTTATIQQIIETLKPTMEKNPDNFPMTYNTFENFILDFTSKKMEIDSIIKTYNVPTDQIVEMLQYLYNIPEQNRIVKTTLTKLKNKISAKQENETSSDDTQ